MKSICLFAFFAVALAACWPAQSFGDELDDLLYGEPSSAQQSTEPVAVPTENSLLDLIQRDVTSYNDQSRWRPAVSTMPARVSVSKTSAAATHPGANSKASEALPPNPVPEPSAVILGGLALLYFMVFGRRRRIA